MQSDLLNKPGKDNYRAVPEEGQQITVERLKELLPHKTNVAVTQEIVDIINNMENDTGLPQELLEEDVMSYMHLIGSTRGVGIKELVNAIKYCNLKRNYENKEAWAIVFPTKYNALVEANKQVDNHVSMYNSSKLVTAIDKEMLIPVSMQYSGYFHAAVKKQFELMNGKSSDPSMKVSPMVEHLAAKELALLTKPLEEQKLSVTVNPSDAALSVQGAIHEQLKEIVASQKQRLRDGADITDVQVIGIDFSEVGRDVD